MPLPPAKPATSESLHLTLLQVQSGTVSKCKQSNVNGLWPMDWPLKQEFGGAVPARTSSFWPLRIRRVSSRHKVLNQASRNMNKLNKLNITNNDHLFNNDSMIHEFNNV